MFKAKFEHQPDNQRIIISRRYNATRSRVWKAWTDASLLDQWWGPNPWRAVTKSFDFSPGGRWLYAMTGPQGEQHWCMVAYKTIDAENSFTARDTFCDEHGNPNPTLPANDWTTRFIDHTAYTDVIVTIDFDSIEDLKTIVEMGFEQGFTAGLNQLQEMLDQPPANSVPVSWKIFIEAARDQVWKMTFDQASYRQWTAAFSEGSFYEGDWTEGEILKFMAPGKDGKPPSGMIAVVRELRPPEFSSVEHLGMLIEGKVDLSSPQVQAWARSFENYTLTEVNGGTEFLVEMNIEENYKDMFNETWPDALRRLKAICERE